MEQSPGHEVMLAPAYAVSVTEDGSASCVWPIRGSSLDTDWQQAFDEARMEKLGDPEFRSVLTEPEVGADKNGPAILWTIPANQAESASAYVRAKVRAANHRYLTRLGEAAGAATERRLQREEIDRRLNVPEEHDYYS